MHVDGLNRWNMPIAMSLKTIVGLVFLFIYSDYYGSGTLSADAGDFMRESKILNNVFYKSPIDYFKFLTGIGDTTELQHRYLLETFHWDAGAQALINDNKNILRLHSVIHFVSFNNPVIHVFFMCLFSIIGVKNLLIGLSARTSLNKTIQFWILILIPSLLFWTSGILKEPILFLGIGFLIRGLLTKESFKKRTLLIVLGALLILGFKPYVIFSLVPVFLFVGLYAILPKFKIIGAFLLMFIIISTALFSSSTKRAKLVHLITRKQQDFKNIGKGGIFAWNGDGFYYFEPNQFRDLNIDGNFITLKKPLNAVIIDHGGFASPIPIEVPADGQSWQIYFMRDESKGYIELTQIDDSFTQLLLNIPEAVSNSLFRPYPNDPGSYLKYPAIFEVCLVFLFLVFAIYKRRKLSKDIQIIIVASIVFILTLSIIIGLTTPVLGAIVRYRIPTTIAIVMIAILIIDPQLKTKSKV